MDGDRQLPAAQGQLIGEPISTTPGSKPWSTGLGRLLTEGEDGRSAVRLIAINKTLRAEAQRLLPVLEQAKAPASEEQILEILVRHAPHYGITAKMAGEWGSFFGAYLDALAGLSPYMIEDAFVRWNRGEGHADIRMAGFYPKAPQLYLLATTARNELACATYRAKRALEYVEEHVRTVTPEERKAAGDGLQALAASLKANRAMPEPPRPTMTQRAMAERIRRARPEIVRTVPSRDDVGDVI